MTAAFRSDTTDPSRVDGRTIPESVERTRFTWRTTADHRLAAVSPELASHCGKLHPIEVGDLLPTRLRELGVDPEGRIGAALAANTTWCRIEVYWPAGRSRLKVELSGTPVFDAAHRLLGYRGFGTICAEDRDLLAAVGRSDAASVAPTIAALAHPVSRHGDRDAASSGGDIGLSASEHSAFDEVARRLRAHLQDEGEADPPIGSSEVDSISVPVVAGAGLAGDHAAVLDQLSIGVLVARAGVALYANAMLLDLLGHADLQAFQRAGDVEAMMGAGTPSDRPDGAAAVMRAGGEVLFVDAQASVIGWEGAAATLISIRRAGDEDIAARLAARTAALRTAERQNEELHAVLDTATDGVAILDASGRLISINRSAEALFGRHGSEVRGELFTILLAADSRAQALEYLDALGGSGVASVMNDGREVVGLTDGGGLIPVFMSLGRLPGEPARYCAVLRDLTPWKRSEGDLDQARRAAERADRSKIDVIARLGDEIQTPLGTILSIARVLLEEGLEPVRSERRMTGLREIHASCTLAMKIVDGWLALTKIEAGKAEFEFSRVNANKIVAECLAEMRAHADRHRVILRLALAPHLPNVVADVGSLRRIIENLLSNAINFNMAGGQVIVSTALTDAGDAVVRIRDTGAGMSETEIQSALEPFWHASNSGGGPPRPGLGLALSKALAQANSAVLHVKSKKNEGTLVEIAFPAARVLSN